MNRQHGRQGRANGKRRGGAVSPVPPGWTGPPPQDVKRLAGHLALYPLFGVGPGGTPRITLFDRRTGLEIGSYHPATGRYRLGSRDGVEPQWRTALRIARECRPPRPGRDRV